MAADQSRKEFALWQARARAILAQFVVEHGDLPLSDRGTLFVVRDADGLITDLKSVLEASHAWASRLRAFLGRHEVRLQCKTLAVTYQQLERTYGAECLREPLHYAISNSLADTSTLSEWSRGRALATIYAQIIDSTDDGDLEDLFVRAYCDGIVLHVFPQWQPWFHKHLFSFNDGHLLSDFGFAGETVLHAARLNDAFFRCAVNGEITGFCMLVADYAGERCEDPVRSRVLAATHEVAEQLSTECDQQLREAINAWSDREVCEQILGIGAARYVERLLDFGYGRLERGFLPVTQWPQAQEAAAKHGVQLTQPDLLRLFFGDSPHYSAAAQHYLKHGLGGLFGATVGCTFLLRTLGDLDSKRPYSSAARVFLECAQGRADSLPDALAAGLGATLLRQLIRQVGGDA